jgi:hypothetical protein
MPPTRHRILAHDFRDVTNFGQHKQSRTPAPQKRRAVGYREVPI